MTEIVDAAGDPPPEEAVAAAVAALREGDIVGIPTDTVYGLAADPWHTGAADRLFRVKGRPRNIELPVFVGDVQQALRLVTAVPASGLRLMEEFWPGPLTIVLPRRVEVDPDLGEEDATIGLRCPAHPVPLAICQAFGPYATTSANRHGDPPATRAEHARLNGVALVLDAGTCDALQSTVVDATGDVPKLLREGAVDWERILEVVKGPIAGS